MINELMKDCIEIIINDKQVQVSTGLTILQACEYAGIQLPRFCFHEQLAIAGNCRMCLVEVSMSVKPIAACAITVDVGMRIYTNTLLVKKAREGILEFLLINHPLDCPICDQGGECDLQDQVMLFGNDRGRFYETKRAVSDLDLGPFVKTVMTRCIHCTRCVRYILELGGSTTLGMMGRGIRSEVGTYFFNNVGVSNLLLSNVLGNVIDLCPVGALTAKPYAFMNRSWELLKVESIDTLDSFGSNIIYFLIGNRVVRVLPLMHIGVNEEWLSDISRFSYDGFFLQRLCIPLMNLSDTLHISNWKNLLKTVFMYINKQYVLLCNTDLDSNTLYTITKYRRMFKNIEIFFKDNLITRNIDFRNNYLFNSLFVGVKDTNCVCLFGINLKKEMPLFLMRLRKEKRCKILNIFIFGGNLNYYSLNEKSLGVNLRNLANICEGKHLLCLYFSRAVKPMVIIGNSIFSSYNVNSVLFMINTVKHVITNFWNGVNCYELGSGLVGSYELGITSFFKRAVYKSVLNVNVNAELLLKKTDIFIGTHGDQFIKNYCKIFPTMVNIEKNGIFYNCEGRAQESKIVQKALNNVKSDCSIFTIFFELLFNNCVNIIAQAIAKKILNININMILYNNIIKIMYNKVKVYNVAVLPYIVNIYIQNNIVKNSRILLKSKKFILYNIYI